MRLTVVTPPAVEPITYKDCKLQLQLDEDWHREWITGRIPSVRTYAEGELNATIITTTLRATYDDSHHDVQRRHIDLPHGPVQAIVSITDKNGNTLDPSHYELRTVGNEDYAYVKNGGQWPYTVTYTAGFGDTAEAVPADLRDAMTAHLAHWFRNREAYSDQTQAPVQAGMERIYSRYRRGGRIW
jgi:uncharacterized phiE125 gp8 family phage protein